MEPNNYSETPLVNKDYKLDKYPDKNGWLYVAIPEISTERHAVFSWLKVYGTIDNYEISNFHLMPLSNGTFYLPVKAEMSQKIGKQEGDWVHVTLFADKSPNNIPEDLLEYLKDSPEAYLKFQDLSGSLQLGIIDWIYSASDEASKIERIDKTLKRLVM